jgi:hypothetical protein
MTNPESKTYFLRYLPETHNIPYLEPTSQLTHHPTHEIMIIGSQMHG